MCFTIGCDPEPVARHHSLFVLENKVTGSFGIKVIPMFVKLLNNCSGNFH